jgi:hypothetical protein
MYGSVSSAQGLLIDGMKIVMQVLVDEFGDRMTRDTREDLRSPDGEYPRPGRYTARR